MIALIQQQQQQHKAKKNNATISESIRNDTSLNINGECN